MLTQPAPPEIVVTDASVWVSWLTPNDSNHRSADLWMDNFTLSGGQMVAPALLLIEVAAAIARLTKDEPRARAAIEYLEQLASLRIAPLDDSLVSDAAYLAARYGLRAGDSIYVTVAHQLSLPLVTFDKEQLTRPVLIKTMQP